MDVICEGVLDLGSKPSSSSSKDWATRLCVLRCQKETTFEYYKDTKKRWQKQVPKGTISLVPSFELSLAHNCSYQFPIKLVDGKGETIYLSAKTYPDMNMWYNCLQRQRVLERPTQGYHEYEVKPKESQSMTLIGATRLDCLLSLTPKKEIVCANAQNRQVLGVWPFGSLRKYWHGTDLFGFEAGRRSPRGEGKFEFVTSQGVRLYKMLDTLTKANSPRNSKVFDARPPVPLPTPPVSSASDSDEERVKESRRAQTLKMASNSIVVSETSPAYQLRRVKTTPSRPPKYLHETVQPESERQRDEEVRSPGLPPPVAAFRGEHINARDPGVEDTYSHTVHKVPEHFQRKAIEHSAVGGGFYNALVHRQSTSSIKLKSGGSDSDELVYDVAFQPNAVNRTVIPVTQDGEYAVAQHPNMDTRKQTGRTPAATTTTTTTFTDGPQRALEPAENPSNLRYVLTETVEKKKIDNPLYESKEDLTDAGDDANDGGLMNNPLYGSKENLFSSPVSQQSKELEAHMANLATQGNGGTTNGIDDSSLTWNPIYGTASDLGTLNREQSEREQEQTTSSEPESTQHSTTDFQTGQVRSGEESPPSQADGAALIVGSDTSSITQNREKTPDTIQRDAKGYSKIDKNKKTINSEDGKQVAEGNKSSEEGCEDDLPPPIPPRNYSIDGESPPQSMEEHQE